MTVKNPSRQEKYKWGGPASWTMALDTVTLQVRHRNGKAIRENWFLQVKKMKALAWAETYSKYKQMSPVHHLACRLSLRKAGLPLGRQAHWTC